MCVLHSALCDHPIVINQTELNDWASSPPEGCALEPLQADNMMHWTITMKGPDSTEWAQSLYEGETFRCVVALLCVRARTTTTSTTPGYQFGLQTTIRLSRQRWYFCHRHPSTRTFTATGTFAWTFCTTGATAGGAPRSPYPKSSFPCGPCLRAAQTRCELSLRVVLDAATHRGHTEATSGQRRVCGAHGAPLPQGDKLGV